MMESDSGQKYGENPPSQEYIAHLAERRELLKKELEGVFPPKARFVWEVGCGHGHFLTAYAEAHPEQLCVGVDMIIERIRRGDKKRDRAQLENLHFVRSEAKFFLEEVPADARISSVYVLFPDPWPKKRHHKHRIMQDDFLHQVAQKAEPDARLYFRTDYRPYFDEVEELLLRHADWELLPKGEAWPFELETVFQSRADSYDSLVARRR